MLKIVHLALIIVVTESLAKGLYALPGKDPGISTCPSSGLPPNAVRQSNELKGSVPQIYLAIKGVASGYIPKETYSVYIQSRDLRTTFNDVLLSLHGDGSGCETGSFESTSPLYYQPVNCSHLVYKDSRDADHAFRFLWTAPTCGCVTIRARVQSADNGAFFLDDDDVVDGHLTKRICRQRIDKMLSQIPKRERSDILCTVTQNLQVSQLVHRSNILSRRKLDYEGMSALEKHALDMALQQRTKSVNMCCGLRGQDRIECLGDVRRRRLDHYCAYGESLIPFTSHRQNYMMEKKRDCCWRLGEGRYHCFAVQPLGDASVQGVWNVKKVEHMDESEPVNDLEDFPAETIQQLAGRIPRMSTRSQAAKQVKAAYIIGKQNGQIQGNKQRTEQQSNKQSIQQQNNSTANIEVVTTQSQDVVPKPSTVSNTVASHTTTNKLRSKILRMQARLECCNMGKVYGGSISKDPWVMCTDKAYSYSRTVRRGRKKCRAFYLRCCVEQFQGSHNEDETDDTDDIDNDDNDDDKQDDVSVYTTTIVLSSAGTPAPTNTTEKNDAVVKNDETDDDDDDDDDDDHSDDDDEELGDVTKNRSSTKQRQRSKPDSRKRGKTRKHKKGRKKRRRTNRKRNL